MKIFINGVDHDLIDEIIKKLGSRTIFNTEKTDSELYDIQIDTERTAIIYHRDDLVLQRLDVDDNRYMHIESFRFYEVILR
ncbi:MAG: hypothetical protein J6Y78_08135 [Paludibacteraceae bacterium]|nr:hypothetical protein [Paludibacteraceae bacterium]